MRCISLGAAINNVVYTRNPENTPLHFPWVIAAYARPPKSMRADHLSLAYILRCMSIALALTHHLNQCWFTIYGNIRNSSEMCVKMEHFGKY